MLDYIESNLIPFVVSVVSVLILLQTIKRAVAKALNVPGLVWYFVAWAMGFGSALLSPLECEGWRCWVNAGIIHGGIALALYPLTKRIVTMIRDKLLPPPKSGLVR